MIVSTPLPIARLEPNDWDKWWNIWNNHAAPLTKIVKSPNHATGLHIGFDVVKSSKFLPVYQACYLDLSVLYPDLFDQIMAVPFDVYGARFVMSLGDFPPHVDNFAPSWVVRNMFTATQHNWYYTNMEGKQEQKLTFPDNTNWWAYLDGCVKHGTRYNPDCPKIILQLFTNQSQVKKYVESVLSTYPQYEISY